MKETCTFRIVRDVAEEFFEGALRKSIVKQAVFDLVLDTSDARFSELRISYLKALSEDKHLFFPWSTIRDYTQAELDAAEWFLLACRKHVEHSGEEYGTRYDDSLACSVCGSGAPVIEPFQIYDRAIPDRYDMVKTMSGDILISTRMKNVRESFMNDSPGGYVVSPVTVVQPKNLQRSPVYRLSCGRGLVDIVAPTMTGVNPFDLDTSKQFECTRCGKLGLNLISELTIKAPSKSHPQLCFTSQHCGIRRGLMRPSRFTVVSSEMRKRLMSEGITGLSFEIARCQ